MKLKHHSLLLLAIVACVAAQSEDELHIPVENDNQFPPDTLSEPDGTIIEGSGVGALDEPTDTETTTSNVPLIEDAQRSIPENNETYTSTSDDPSCPKPCVCRIEGDPKNFVVDCSGYGLTEFPTPLNENTTSLLLQNNKLTEIPRDISLLKGLKELNAENNQIMDLASGSISELPELKVLKLGKNRLIEYPQDLKNGFGLTKLAELDLGGNDMRTVLNPDTLLSFKALQKLTLPTTSNELLEDLCKSLKDSLEVVCTESCSTKTYECPDASPSFDDDLLNIILPGTISLTANAIDNKESSAKQDNVFGIDDVETTPANEEPQESTEAPSISSDKSGFSFRSSVNKLPDNESPLSTIVEAPKRAADEEEKNDVAVGATTSDSKTGGVDKSVIGMIIAGMIVVVAGITIKKNWSSIKKKFSSSPRPANERAGANTNGVSPEEVPLQEKSPV